MDIDQHVNQIVQNIVAEITTKVQQQAMSAIEQKISEVISTIDTRALLGERLSQKIDERLNQLPIDTQAIQTELTSRVERLASTLSTTVQNNSLTMINESIQNQIKRIDFQDLCQATLIAAIQKNQFTYPDNSIPATAINSTGLKISGANVVGGIIENFGSTGIDDKATACQLSIFDDVTVVENNLLTRDLTVKGSTTIEGDLIVTGNVPKDSAMYQSLVASVSDVLRGAVDHEAFTGYSTALFERIKNEGIDLNKITLNGHEIVNGSNLSNNITFSNLQRVGTLTELRVGGESLLAQTLYTTSKRVGINTIEPTHALSIWDQEVEFGFGKRETNVAVFETPRNQTLIVGTNGKNNLTLLPDGSIAVARVNIGATTLSSAATPPSYDAAQGSIVFNSNPSIGGPLGWVSLGGARWANFGFID